MGSRPLPTLLAAGLVICLAGVGSVAGQAAAPTDSAGSQVPDSVRAHLSAGRFWKASLALRRFVAPLESASLSDRVLLAEAEAGWKNWDAALGALSGADLDAAPASSRAWYVLGTAHNALGHRAEAESAFRRFVAETEAAVGGDEALRDGAGSASREALIALAHLPRLANERDDHDETLATLDRLARRSQPVADWTALHVARRLLDGGDAGAVETVLASIADPDVLAVGWSLRSDARAAAGDTARALEALRSVRLPTMTVADSAAWLGREWRYLLALGDSVEAVEVMEELLRLTSTGPEAVEAARAHWDVASNSGPVVLRRVATAFGSGNEFGLAARAWTIAAERGAVLTESDRLALARAYNGSNARDRAIELYRELSASDDPAVGAAALSAWATIRTRQGRQGDARILRERLVERFPASRQAVDIVFFRGDSHHDAGRIDQAIREYSQASAMLPTADRAGLARMRWAQIHLTQDEPQRATEIFRDYLEDFPQGRRWEEASYWAIQAGRAAGDTTGSGALAARLLRESPLSYYAHLAAEMLGLPATLFVEPDPGAGASPPPAWLTAKLDVLAVLDGAELDEAADALVANLRTSVADSVPRALELAHGLIDHGRSIDGIRLGLQLRDQGVEWSRALLAAVYPFPYRELITSRANELGLDPYLVAGLIRQESAFTAGIASRAGAIGLMQIMPATGRQLARSEGPAGYTTESLQTAEVNVQLGTKYLADLLERYDGYIPLVLSAYNAGPTRANRWRRFPEAEDPYRLTERIPFVETRGYVKAVVRNRDLYRWLYGPQ